MILRRSERFLAPLSEGEFSVLKGEGKLAGAWQVGVFHDGEERFRDENRSGGVE